MYVNAASRSKEKMMKLRASLLDYQEGVKISGRQLVQPKINHIKRFNCPSVYDNLITSPRNGPFSTKNAKSLRTSMKLKE